MVYDETQAGRQARHQDRTLCDVRRAGCFMTPSTLKYSVYGETQPAKRTECLGLQALSSCSTAAAPLRRGYLLPLPAFISLTPVYNLTLSYDSTSISRFIGILSLKIHCFNRVEASQLVRQCFSLKLNCFTILILFLFFFYNIPLSKLNIQVVYSILDYFQFQK